MDSAANPDEVRLRKGAPLRERLLRAGTGASILLILVPGLLMWASGGPPFLVAVLAAPVGLFLIGIAALERNVAWIITADGILIGEQRPFGKVHKRSVDNHDIVEIDVRKNRLSYPRSFSLACTLVSGDALISPPLPDITRVNETGAIVAQLLGLPDVPQVNNPLDATNAEITLGSLVSPELGRVFRLIVPGVAVLCALPFLIALWFGHTELALGLLLPLGLLAAFALYRYNHRLSGEFWIIRHGEIRVERVALNGQPMADTIRAGDIAAIEVRKFSSQSNRHIISIRLRADRTFRSPTTHAADEAEAVRAEIIRRLNLPANIGTPAG
jgi:membrane protein implicated in regulation of membrane protease activity